jgi:hypothetical protein
VKLFKDGNPDNVNQPLCGRPRTAATERNKQQVDELMSAAARYVQTLNKLRRALCEKCQKKKTVVLQHDNATSHNARLTLQTIQNNG